MIEIENRRSIRKYKDLKVEDNKIAALIESARLAPSGSNTQPWQFIIIDDKLLIAKISKAAHNQKWIASAPLIVVCIADSACRMPEGKECKLQEDTPDFEVKQIIRDTAIAIEHIVLEAVHQGLGSCWVSWFSQNDIRPLLGIPESKFVVTLVTLGYADEAPLARTRKATKQIVHKNKW